MACIPVLMVVIAALTAIYAWMNGVSAPTAFVRLMPNAGILAVLRPLWARRVKTD